MDCAAGEGPWRQWTRHACRGCPVLLEVQRWALEEPSRSCRLWGALICCALSFCSIRLLIPLLTSFTHVHLHLKRIGFCSSLKIVVKWSTSFFSLQVKLRMEGDKPYVTDNSNYIIDLYFQGIEVTYLLFYSLRIVFFCKVVRRALHVFLWLNTTAILTLSLSNGSQDPIKDANAAAQAISALEGVVDHGLFLNMASAVIIAGSDGVTVQTKDT